MSKVVILGGAWYLSGAVIGFALVFFFCAAQGPSGRFGNMAGVAGISYGIIFGAPVGGLLFGSLGTWWGSRLKRRSRPPGTDD